MWRKGSCRVQRDKGGLFWEERCTRNVECNGSWDALKIVLAHNSRSYMVLAQAPSTCMGGDCKCSQPNFEAHGYLQVDNRAHYKS